MTGYTRYKRKTNCGHYGEEKILAALQAMKTEGIGLWAAALRYGMPKSTLEHHCNKKLKSCHFSLGRKTILGPDNELQLKDFLFLMEKRRFGLTPHEVQRLAYDYAEANFFN